MQVLADTLQRSRLALLGLNIEEIRLEILVMSQRILQTCFSQNAKIVLKPPFPMEGHIIIMTQCSLFPCTSSCHVPCA